MKKFQLCYEIPGKKNNFIAPQRFSDNQPEYDWNESQNLILRYAYPDFMPKGLITRLKNPVPQATNSLVLDCLKGEIKTLDERLSGQIQTVDEKLSGQIKTLDTKVEQLDKRIANQEFINRGVIVGLIIVMLGGAIKLFELGNF